MKTAMETNLWCTKLSLNQRDFHWCSLQRCQSSFSVMVSILNGVFLLTRDPSVV